MRKRVSAVVLAAGRAERMGRLKQLLPFGDRTVIETVVQTLLATDVDEIVVVLGSRVDDVRAVLADLPIRCVVNPDYEAGMFSSVLCGLAHVEADSEGLMLLLGDQPQIRVSVVQVVLDRFRSTDKGIVIPEVEGSRGHPVAIDIGRYGEVIRALDGSEGLKPLVRGHSADTELILVQDDAILRDMDTPEDYERELRLRDMGDRGKNG
jgi:molybdenum cofactor cytidylyltransferase